MSYKKTSGVGRFFKVIGVMLLILLVITAVTAILYATIPEVKEFILKVFKISSYVKTATIS